MEIVVRDRLHPQYHLSEYDDDPDPASDPILSVWLDVSDASISTEFLDLLLIDHFQVPGERSYLADLELEADNQVYLRVSEGENIAGRPVIVPHFEGWNVHWVGVHLRHNADGRIIRDTSPQGQTNNNYEIIRYQANADLTAWELFLRDNPCAPNTQWGRAAKCTLNVMTWLPGSKVQAEVVSTMLALCETMFNIANGRIEDAALGAGSTYGGSLYNYLEAHPEVLYATKYGPQMATVLGTLGNTAKVVDCYNALTDWTGEIFDEPVSIKVQIVLLDKSLSYEDRYSGTFLISNNADLQYYDKYWLFPYQPGQSLNHFTDGYDPLGGFLDFYVYLILASEYDKFGEFLGNPYFDLAKQIADQGMFNTQFRVGWRERTEFITGLLSDEHRPFRAARVVTQALVVPWAAKNPIDTSATAGTRVHSESGRLSAMPAPSTSSAQGTTVREPRRVASTPARAELHVPSR